MGPDVVVVRVAAASINQIDYKIVHGYLDRAFPTVFPLVPGWDVAGDVVAVAPAVTHVEVGQRVYAYARRRHTPSTRTTLRPTRVPAPYCTAPAHRRFRSRSRSPHQVQNQRRAVAA